MNDGRMNLLHEKKKKDTDDGLEINNRRFIFIGLVCSIQEMKIVPDDYDAENKKRYHK